MKTIITIILLLFASQSAIASDGTYNAVVKGKKCYENSNHDLECSYKVGKTLHIVIAGIGSPNTGVYFLKSDSHGDYYGLTGPLYGWCIMVHSVKDGFDFAYISPKNGKVYKSGPECKSGM